MNATSGRIATIVPSIVCPFSYRFAFSEASNIVAKSSSGSATGFLKSTCQWLRADG